MSRRILPSLGAGLALLLAAMPGAPAQAQPYLTEPPLWEGWFMGFYGTPWMYGPASAVPDLPFTPAEILGHPTQAQFMWFCGGAPACAGNTAGTAEAFFNIGVPMTVSNYVAQPRIVLEVVSDTYLSMIVNGGYASLRPRFSQDPAWVAPFATAYDGADNRDANGWPLPMYVDITDMLVTPESHDVLVSFNSISIYSCSGTSERPAPGAGASCVGTRLDGPHFVLVEGFALDPYTGVTQPLASGPAWWSLGRANNDEPPLEPDVPTPVPAPGGLGVLLVALAGLAATRRLGARA